MPTDIEMNLVQEGSELSENSGNPRDSTTVKNSSSVVYGFLIGFHKIHVYSEFLIMVIQAIFFLVISDINHGFKGIFKGKDSDTAMAAVVLALISHIYIAVSVCNQVFWNHVLEKYQNPVSRQIKDRLLLERIQLNILGFIVLIHDMVYGIILMNKLLDGENLHFLFDRSPLPVIYGIVFMISLAILAIQILTWIGTAILDFFRASAEEAKLLLRDK